MSVASVLDNHPLLRIAAAWIAGIVVGDAWGPAVPLWVWLAAAAVALGAAWGAGRRSEAVQGAAILAGTTCLSIAVATGHIVRQTAVPTGRQLTYKAIVTSEPRERGKTIRCDLSIVQLEGHTPAHPLRLKASLLKDGDRGRWQRLHLGDGLVATSVVTAARRASPHSHFDPARWMQVQGFAGHTFVHHRHWHRAAVNTARLSRLDRARLKALQLRATMVCRYRALGIGTDEQAVLAAMTLGDKSMLTDTLKTDYAVSGASHVLALSGLHLGIVYALLLLLTGRSRRWRWLAQGVVLTGGWSYVVLVGMPTSAVRSATMLTVCSLGMLVGRQRASVNTLAFAALAMLAIHPPTLWDVGFQMSFMAVLSILVYYRPLYHLLTPSHRALRWLWGLTAVSVAAQIGTAPLVMYYFGRFSCYFLLANLVVVPAATAILYGAVLLLATSFSAPLQQVVATGLAWIVGKVNGTLALLARLPGASIEGIDLSLAQLYLIYMALLSLTVLAHYALKAQRQRQLDAFY